MQTLIRMTVILVGAGLSFNAVACGDSLYRVGKGVSYRTYSAPLPGNLLILGSVKGANELAEQLANSGHTVRIAATSGDLRSELDKGEYEVLILPYDELRAMDTNPGVPVVPIVNSGADAKLAKQSYGSVVIQDKHELKHYLKAIHIALRSNA